jgi:hypothetical protein
MSFKNLTCKRSLWSHIGYLSATPLSFLRGSFVIAVAGGPWEAAQSSYTTFPSESHTIESCLFALNFLKSAFPSLITPK